MMISTHIYLHSTTPGTFPQAGKLIGSNQQEFVLELDTGVRLHYPRIGYIVRKA